MTGDLMHPLRLTSNSRATSNPAAPAVIAAVDGDAAACGLQTWESAYLQISVPTAELSTQQEPRLPVTLVRRWTYLHLVLVLNVLLFQQQSWSIRRQTFTRAW